MSIYFCTHHSRIPMKLTHMLSEENQNHWARSIPIGANRRRGAPKKLWSGLRYQPTELVESDDEFLNFFYLF